MLNDFGPLGRAYVETDETKADEATVVENILTGQYSHPLRVIAFNMAEGWTDDVTEDIAIAVLSRARSDHRLIGKVAKDFLERALGADALWKIRALDRTNTIATKPDALAAKSERTGRNIAAQSERESHRSNGLSVTVP